MELMETSLDILYKLVYGKLGQAIPEDILGVVALAVSTLHVTLPLIFKSMIKTQLHPTLYWY
jgi:hypothetical protein